MKVEFKSADCKTTVESSVDAGGTGDDGQWRTTVESNLDNEDGTYSLLRAEAVEGRVWQRTDVGGMSKRSSDSTKGESVTDSLVGRRHIISSLMDSSFWSAQQIRPPSTEATKFY